MRHLFAVLSFALLSLAQTSALQSGDAAVASEQEGGFWVRVKPVIEVHLGRPYVWGACGMKSFDCSGFVWRVMNDSGIMIKRTTARKFYMCLPRVEQKARWSPGNIVFFDDLKHCGIVAGPRTFYHSESSIGTNLSKFDPYWRRKIYGFRTMPQIH